MLAHETYLALLLTWALPVLVLQWAIGGRILRPRIGLLIIATLLPTAYLVIADSVAIHTGIWTLHNARILGPRLLRVPVEEALFFLLTNLMVTQSVTLLMVIRVPGRHRRTG